MPTQPALSFRGLALCRPAPPCRRCDPRPTLRRQIPSLLFPCHRCRRHATIFPRPARSPSCRKVRTVTTGHQQRASCPQVGNLAIKHFQNISQSHSGIIRPVPDYDPLTYSVIRFLKRPQVVSRYSSRHQEDHRHERPRQDTPARPSHPSSYSVPHNFSHTKESSFLTLRQETREPSSCPSTRFNLPRGTRQTWNELNPF